MYLRDAAERIRVLHMLLLPADQFAALQNTAESIARLDLSGMRTHLLDAIHKRIDPPVEGFERQGRNQIRPLRHGATKDAIRYVSGVLLTEINSVTDNPTIFPDEDKIISGGNFHGQPLAISYDFLAIALAELGNISERRVAQLIMGLRGLPEFLVANPGLNSGFMIPQYAAASMVSQNKMYCYAASSDSIVSSNGQEDHVSMGTSLR